jgi:hypothetical protein
MGKIVHLVDRVNVRAGTLQAAFDDLAKGFGKTTISGSVRTNL